MTGITVTVARVTDIALIGLGVACWPGPSRLCMLIYSVAVTLYLAYIGMSGASTGILMWPAVVLHAIIAALTGPGISGQQGAAKIGEIVVPGRGKYLTGVPRPFELLEANLNRLL